MSDMKAALFRMNSESAPQSIKSEDLDRITYQKKYRGRLYCANNCDAKVKFFQKPNGENVFHSWPNHGHLHNSSCPHFKEQEGEGKNIKYEDPPIALAYSTNQILNSFVRLFRELNKDNSNVDKKKQEKNALRNTTTPKKSGSTPKRKPQFSTVSATDTDTAKRMPTRLISPRLEYKHLDKSKILYGQVVSIETLNEEFEPSIMINLQHPQYQVSLSFAPTFYHAFENNTSKEELIQFATNIKNALNQHQFLVAAGVGRIRQKSDDWFHVEMLDPSCISVNTASYAAVRINPSIPEMNLRAL